jgi:hypothetical protein
MGGGPHKILFSRNHGWLIKAVGNDEKDLFMNTVFNNTRIQWAYNIINPALYAFGTMVHLISK